MSMVFMVVGLGSMGKRRISILTRNFPDFRICGVDFDSDRRIQARDRFPIHVYRDMDECIDREKPEAVFVCTSPASHAAIILKCIEKGLSVFSEINLLKDGYEEIQNAARRKNVQLFLSSTLLYRKEIEYIRECVCEQKTKLNYRYHVGQYLPDWHPWESGKDFFVWEKKTNGCREIFAIELPWIIKTFGNVKSLSVAKDQISTLEVDYPDNYIVFLEHENGNKGVFFADIISRRAVRELLVYSENLYLSWNGAPDSLFRYHIEKKSMEFIETYAEIDKNPEYAESIIENAYLEELKVFLEKITKQRNREKYTFEEDLATLGLIDRIEGIK